MSPCYLFLQQRARWRDEQLADVGDLLPSGLFAALYDFADSGIISSSIECNIRLGDNIQRDVQIVKTLVVQASRKTGGNDITFQHFRMRKQAKSQNGIHA